MQGAAHTGGRGSSGDIREPMWCNGSTQAQNARDVCSILALGTIFPIFITPTTYIYMCIYVDIYIHSCVCIYIYINK